MALRFKQKAEVHLHGKGPRLCSDVKQSPLLQICCIRITEVAFNCRTQVIGQIQQVRGLWGIQRCCDGTQGRPQICNLQRKVDQLDGHSFRCLSRRAQ